MAKLKDKVKKTVKKVFIITGVLFAIFAFLIGYLVVKDLKQEELLKQEIINYSNKNLATDNFDITVKKVKVSAGAGFIVVLTGDILTMPGLPKTPAAEKIDVDENGVISGLF